MKHAVKRLLARNPRLFALAQRAYRAFQPEPPTEKEVLRALARAKDSATFLQIGAHDGKTDDHLYALVTKHRWKGILVEPTDYLFERLKENYRGVSGVAFDNRAISTSTGRRPFYSL